MTAIVAPSGVVFILSDDIVIKNFLPFELSMDAVREEWHGRVNVLECGHAYGCKAMDLNLLAQYEKRLLIGSDSKCSSKPDANQFECLICGKISHKYVKMGVRVSEFNPPDIPEVFSKLREFGESIGISGEMFSQQILKLFAPTQALDTRMMAKLVLLSQAIKL